MPVMPKLRPVPTSAAPAAGHSNPGTGRRKPAKSAAVAVLGAGHGGLALAGYLASRGARVGLWNRSPGPINAVELLGHVQLSLPAGHAPTQRRPVLRRATCDLAAALQGVRLALVALPACAHRDVARLAAPHLLDGQTILLLPGRTGGALEFRRELLKHGCTADVTVAEAQTFPFASRATGPGAAAIHGIKRRVEVAALPSHRTAEALAACRPLLPMLAPAHSVLHTSFDNMGAMLHPVISLLNAGRIESAGSFRFYVDGVTPAVAAVLARADAERLAVARSYGVGARSLLEWLADAYGDGLAVTSAAGADDTASHLRQVVTGNAAYREIQAPTALDHRYLREDIPTGLVPLVELGRAAGVPCPTLAGLVQMASALHGVDYQTTGRTLARLGLAGLTPAQVRRLVDEGEAGAFPPAEDFAAENPRGHELELPEAPDFDIAARLEGSIYQEVFN